MPAIWTLPASCSMVESASSPLPCSDRPVVASRPRLTGASTAAAMTWPRRSRRSAAGCATRSTWTPSRPSCWRSSIRRCNRPPRLCGYGLLSRDRGAPGPKLPTRCASWSSPGLYQAFTLGRRQSVVPSCTRSSRGVVARPVSNRVSIHDLRHTAVALWIAAGASPKEVAVRAGHSSVSFTLDRYGHLYPESDTALRDRLDAIFATSEDVDEGVVIDLPARAPRPQRGPAGS
jgi:hypothetical protein